MIEFLHLRKAAKVALFGAALFLSGSLSAQNAELLLYLPLDGTVEDSKTGDKTTLTLSSTGQAANFSTGKLGQCLDFDAAGNLPIYDTPESFLIPEPETDENPGFSMSCWIQINDVSKGHQILVQKDDASNTGRLTVNVSGAQYLSTWVGGGGGLINQLQGEGEDHVFSANQWYHVVLVVNTTDDVAYFYQNGVKLDYSVYLPGDGPLFTNTAAWRLFGNKNSTAANDGMKVDEVFIFDGMLTDAQITDLYNLDHSDWDNTTSISEVRDAADISVYPNPTSGMVNVSGAEAFSSYSIISLTGAIVKAGVAESGQINLGDLQNGIYFVKIGANISKITVQK